MKFYICKKCGSILTSFNHVCAGLTCCGELMSELVPGTTDAAVEKHVPVVSIDGENVFVKVGEVEHPMVEKHYIQWIVLETDKGYMTKYLKPEEKPEAAFRLADGEKAVAAYEYCNLHGLWKKEL